MEPSNNVFVEVNDCNRTGYARVERVFRVIDDGDCILTTVDPEKALLALGKLIEKHDITACWFDVERLK